MLPFDNRPWAKSLARAVIALSLIGAALGAYYCYATDQLHISEVAIIGLLLLTILPPNIAIVNRKTEGGESAGAITPSHLRAR